ncbi:hypothetical protein [Paenibacillus sp. LHD-38]|uniref:hypothetical protein n=1 Tax=Paenibacillus sp. LHD-38 TaxID=3072143 RepID=UPI00280EEBD2|nr:hypothetical protein [Paenibacillus sp. LHD-38]MDQ8738685.1 hypothetical protein [Paenibacillus sp. LHD-38]
MIKTFIDPALIEKGRIEGEIKGRIELLIEMILESLEEKGNLQPELVEKISAEREFIKLKNWNKLASRIKSVDEFERRINQN